MSDRIINSQFLDEILFDKSGPLTLYRALGEYAATLTDQTLVAATSGKSIRLIRAYITTNANTTFAFRTKPAGAGTLISAAHRLLAATPVLLPTDPTGYWQTTVSQGLNIDAGAGGNVYIDIEYVLL